ncbi:MAG: RNA polymerase sigma-70 factor (ECF subfamily) [Saprospiraceae bacterium]
MSLNNESNDLQSSMDMTDEQILSLLKNETSYEKGFRTLMEKYQERLYWHIRKMVYEHDDANDVIQNTFIKVYRSIERFEGKSQLYTWLYRIATNESITFLNKKKKKQTTSIDDGETNLSNRLKADEYFDGDEIQMQLQLALERLPEKQRMVFNMRYFDEMSYADISEVLETSVGALKASYHHASKKIESYLKSLSEG